MDTLNPGEALEPGQSLDSANGYHTLVLQYDGNLVLYSLGQALWDTATDGKSVRELVNQYDGNLVLYDTDGNAIWDSNTAGQGRSTFQLQPDRNAVLYKEGTVESTWSTETWTPEHYWDKLEFRSTVEIDQVLPMMREDPQWSPFCGIGVVCVTSVEGFLICTAALIVIAIILESNKDGAWGPNNDLRVLGGQISDDVKRAGRSLGHWIKGGLVLPDLPIPVPKWPF